MPIGQMALWAGYPPGFWLGFRFELHTQILVTNAKCHKKRPAVAGRLGIRQALVGLHQLLQQGQNALGGLVGLRQHGGGRLRDDLRTGQAGGLCGVVGVQNAAA